MSLARRSITSVAWNSIANWVSHAVLFVRAVFLARWLPVDVFGVYALATSVVSLITIVAEFGMAGAFVHRAPETKDEKETAAAHFTLKLIIGITLVALLSLSAFAFSDGTLRTTLLLLAATTGVSQLTQTPKRVLVRRVVHRRLALLSFIDAFVSTLVALGLAWRGATLWALLSTNVSSVILTVFALYVWKPVWQPRLTWSPQVVRYFLSFGSRSFLASVLYRAVNRIDDLWVGFYLGEASLGFYSKAYSFATYPRKVLAAPVNTVAIGTYAELKSKRQELSRVFFRVNALLVRSGFFMGGGLALVAPEFIRLVLGVKWLPMLSAFQLMLVFTLLDPIKRTIGNLFIAAGDPEGLVKIRLFQLGMMVIGLYLLGPSLGIAGVALAVNGVVILGIGLLLRHARKYVDLSIRRLFLMPTLALATGMLLARGTLFIPGLSGSDWRTAGVKLSAYAIVYVGFLILQEQKEVRIIFKYVREAFTS